MVYDIPLLVESGHAGGMIWTESSWSTAHRKRRSNVQQRNGLSPVPITAILEAQTPRLRACRAADAVVCNDGITFHQLEDLVTQVWARFGPHDSASESTSVILYEYPLTRRIRTYLRLEHLFLRMSKLMSRDDPLTITLQSPPCLRSWMWRHEQI